jgi:hypothetical protein
MKRYITTFFCIAAFLCGFSQGTVSLNLCEFRKDNDSLTVDYRIRISPRSIESGQGLIINPFLEAGDSVVFLPGSSVFGANKRKVIERHDKNYGKHFITTGSRKDTTLAYAVRIPYRAWMDSARLCVRQEMSGYRGRNTVVSYKLGGLRLYIPITAVDTLPGTSQPAGKETVVKYCRGMIHLDFPVSISAILPGFGRNAIGLAGIEQDLRETLNRPGAVLGKFHICGYASPEGPYASNERLSLERAHALKDYLINKYALEESLFAVTSVAEDWDGLAELVGASGMPQKDQILAIIATTGISEGRESALMRLDNGIPYRQMLSEMFPVLRRVEYRIDYSVTGQETGR